VDEDFSTKENFITLCYTVGWDLILMGCCA